MKAWMITAAALGMCLSVGCTAERGPISAAQADEAAPGSQPNAAGSQPKGAPSAASVDFGWPPAGAKIFATSAVAFLAEGVTITPAGQHVADHTRGHHHLIIDGGPITAGAPVPKDATHLHFGKGQTQAPLTLSPGEHSLTMQLADGAHISYGPALAKTIQVKVVADPAAPPAVRFVSPAPGASVPSPVKVVMALTGFTVRPAGQDALDHTTGHHHIIVDGEPVPLGQVVPKDATHIHFGKGQTEASLKLSPGPHTLTLQLADGAHRSYGARLSTTIKVTVTK